VNVAGIGAGESEVIGRVTGRGKPPTPCRDATTNPHQNAPLPDPAR